MIIDSARLNGPCSCGREHVMVTKEAVIEAGCMEKLDFYAAKYGLTGRRAVVYDENTYHAKNIIHPKAAQEIVPPDTAPMSWASPSFPAPPRPVWTASAPPCRP